MTASGSGQINTAFWNLQNLFDVEPSGIAADLGISAINGWDRRALEARVASLSTGIRAMFDGAGPDLLGLAEIENEKVGRQLMVATGRDDYELVMAEHPLTTAAGTALIYSRDTFDEASVTSCGHLVHQRYLTCDLLEVRLKVRGTDTELHVLVNHWPSRREAHSDAFRQAIASHCSRLVGEQLKMSRREYVELSDTEVSRHQLTDRWNTNLLLMGSFNDDPWSASLHDVLNARYSMEAMRQPLPLPGQGLPSWRSYAANCPELFNTAWALLSRPDQSTVGVSGSGSRTGLLDQIILSRGPVLGQSGLQVMTDSQGVPQMHCLAAELLAGRDGHPVPFSCDTFEGFSDRLPVGLSLQQVSATGQGDATAAVSSSTDRSASVNPGTAAPLS